MAFTTTTPVEDATGVVARMYSALDAGLRDALTVGRPIAAA